MIEKNEQKFSSVKIIIVGWAMMASKINLNEPLRPFRIGTNKNEKKRYLIIDSKKCLCDHGGLHTMIPRKGRYIPGNI